MGKVVRMCCAFALSVFCSPVFAQESATPAMPQAGSVTGMARSHGMRGLSPQAMMLSKEKITETMEVLVQMALMYKMVEPAKVVSSADGGAIVAFGNKIIKYDKDLNVVKEVKLDVDTDALNGMAHTLAMKYSDEIVRTIGLNNAKTGVPAPGSEASPAASSDDLREERIHQEIEQMK